MHTGFGEGNAREKEHLEDLGTEEGVILKQMVKNSRRKA